MNIEKCKKIIQEYFGENVSIEAIGNHDLGRHFVFKITNTKSYVMKFYFKEHKWEREVSALKMLNEEQLKVPIILDKGNTYGIEWMLYEYLEGSNLSTIKLSENELISVYYNLGKEVAKIHKVSKYQTFGRLNSDGEFYIINKSNKEYLKYIFDSTIENLMSFTHEREALIKQAISTFNESFDQLDEVKDGYFCHNDINDRNILIHNRKFQLLYDFEQSSIIDRYLELATIKYYLISKNERYFEAFIEGYKEIFTISIDTLEKREKTYMLLHGLMICSWTLNVNVDYYNEGLNILETYSKIM